MICGMARIVALVFLVAGLATARLEIHFVILGFVVVVGGMVMGLPAREFLKRIVFVLPLLLGILVLNPKEFPIVAMKTLNALGCAAIITGNFDVFAVSRVLRRLGMPAYFIEIFLLAFRYSHTFVDEVLRLKANLRLRGSFRRRHFWQAGFLGSVVAHFLGRSVWKSQRVYHAMKLRGYGQH